MKLKNKKIRSLYQSITKQEMEKRSDCPDMDTLIESFTEELNETQKYQIIDHISECSDCLEKFDLVEHIFKHSKKMALGKKKISMDENEVKELRQLSKRKVQELEARYRKSNTITRSKSRALVLFFPKIPVKYLSIAAVLIIVFLGTVLIFRTPPASKDDTLRGERTEDIQLITPRGDGEEMPLIFRWNPVQDAEEYEVRLLNSELIKIWNSNKISGTHIKIPEDIQQKIKPNTIYYWRVTGYFKNGDIKKSTLVEFEIKTK